MSSNSPIPPTRLGQICNDACDSALSTATQYDHAATQQWNTSIINKILASLISESTPSSSSQPEGEAKAPKYKFAVNSTIIQHLSDPRPAGTSSGTTQTGEEGDAALKSEIKSEGEDSVSMGADAVKKVGRRGMHSASGAYWNNEKDGMWSHKYESGEGKGMDIVISIMWIVV